MLACTLPISSRLFSQLPCRSVCPSLVVRRKQSSRSWGCRDSTGSLGPGTSTLLLFIPQYIQLNMLLKAESVRNYMLGYFWKRSRFKPWWVRPPGILLSFSIPESLRQTAWVQSGVWKWKWCKRKGTIPWPGVSGWNLRWIFSPL